jgi:hypothetical protein
MYAVAIERAIAAGELEKRTAAPRETRRHLPPNRAEYTQPNGDHPGHIAAELYAKRDTSTRRADITEDKARTGRVDRWIDGTRPERASTLATFCHLAYQQCFPDCGSRDLPGLRSIP